MHFYHVKSYLSKFKSGKLKKVHELKKNYENLAFR